MSAPLTLRNERPSMSSHADLAATIDAAFEARAEISFATKGAVREAVATALDLLDSGKARVAEKGPDGWIRKPVAEEGRFA